VCVAVRPVDQPHSKPRWVLFLEKVIHIVIFYFKISSKPAFEMTEALQHYTATHSNTLQHIATHCSTLQHNATHCNALQYNTRKSPRSVPAFELAHSRSTTASHCITLQHTAAHCNALQHTATHCNITLAKASVPSRLLRNDDCC